MHQDTAQRIAMLRYLMIVGIVVLHTPPFVPITEIGPTLFDQVKAFFQNAGFRATVPVLTLISGFLLFRTGLDQQWHKLATKKARTILVPFLVFNLGLLAAAYALQRATGITTSYALIPFDARTWLDAAFGLTRSPINYPLNFLRDLIVLMLLAPLFGLFLRKAPWLGLAVVALVFLNDVDGLLVLRGLMPVMFYIGGMAAVRRWNLQALDGYAWLCLAAFVLSCMAMLHWRVTNVTYLGLVAPFLIWPAASLLHGSAIGRWLQQQSKYSFFIFIAHAPILLATWMVFQKLGGRVPYVVYWVGAPLLVVALLTVVYRIAAYLMPSAFAFITGGCTARAGESEQRRATPELAGGHSPH